MTRNEFSEFIEMNLPHALVMEKTMQLMVAVVEVLMAGFVRSALSEARIIRLRPSRGPHRPAGRPLCQSPQPPPCHRPW